MTFFLFSPTEHKDSEALLHYQEKTKMMLTVLCSMKVELVPKPQPGFPVPLQEEIGSLWEEVFARGSLGIAAPKAMANLFRKEGPGDLCSVS